MDFYTNLTFKVQNGRGLLSRDPISKFWDPLITLERIDICFKFGTDIDDGPLLRPDHKTTPKWAWPRSRDRILHSKYELLTCQLMLAPTSNVNDMFINKNKTANIKGKNNNDV